MTFLLGLPRTRYFRFHKLGKGYSLDEIKERILHNLQKQAPFPEVVHRPPRRYRVRGKPRKKVTGLRALYFRYCYELHIMRSAWPARQGSLSRKWRTPGRAGLTPPAYGRSRLRASTTERDFLRVMGEMGYQLKTRGKGGKPLKYPALKPPDAGGYFRFHKLGKGYSLDEIKERILHVLPAEPV